MHAGSQCAPTLFEMTTLHELVAAVRRRCAQQGVKVALGRWMDNRSGVVRLVSYPLNDSSTEIMQRVEARDEILFAGYVLTGWAPAQHDTKCTDTI